MPDLAPPGWRQADWVVYTDARLHAILYVFVGLLTTGTGMAYGTSAIEVRIIESGEATGFTVDAILLEPLLTGLLLNTLGVFLGVFGVVLWRTSTLVRSSRWTDPEGETDV